MPPLVFDPASPWGQMQQAGESAIGARYAPMRETVQAGMTRRIGRTGLTATELSKLSGAEELEKGELGAEISARKAEYERQQAEASSAARRAKKKAKKAKKKRKYAAIGTALGAVIGTIAFPGVGTVAGAAAGGALGSAFG